MRPLRMQGMSREDDILFAIMMQPDSRVLVDGAGFLLRRSFIQELSTEKLADFPDFFEMAPENWMGPRRHQQPYIKAGVRHAG